MVRRHNEARAFVRASYLPGHETGSASAKMEVDLRGVDDATLQAITDKAYALFLDQLKAAGRVDTKTGEALSLTGRTTSARSGTAAHAVLSQATGAFAKLFAAHPAL